MNAPNFCTRVALWQQSVVFRIPHFDSAMYRIDTEQCSCTDRAKYHLMIFMVFQRYIISAMHRLLQTGLSLTLNNKQKRRYTIWYIYDMIYMIYDMIYDTRYDIWHMIYMIQYIWEYMIRYMIYSILLPTLCTYLRTITINI